MPSATLEAVLKQSYNRANLLEFFQQVRSHSMQLISPLSAEDCSLQAAAFTSPAKWHLAHTTWFFETFILLPHVAGYQEFNGQFQFLFNSYYNGIGEQYSRPKRHLLSRPSLDEVVLYREHVDRAIETLLLDGEEFGDLIELGLHHEMQHQELLLMDLKYCFFQNPLYPVYSQTSLPNSQALSSLEFKSYSGGLYDFGYSNDGFHYDNEGPKHLHYLNNYKLANRKISNGEYLQFIEAGGYSDAMLWLSDGWAWKQEQNIQHPLYWVLKDSQWFEFTLHGLVPLDLNAPVCHVSFYESHAFSHWAQKRLATELEWENAAGYFKHNSQSETLLRQYYHPLDTTQGLNQTWVWTASSYQPYPGYTAPQGAIGEYNGKFMCNQMVLRGGCALTPPGHIRRTYRNFFYPQDRWITSGILLADD